jgi:hypothetical protein
LHNDALRLGEGLARFNLGAGQAVTPLSVPITGPLPVFAPVAAPVMQRPDGRVEMRPESLAGSRPADPPAALRKTGTDGGSLAQWEDF